MSWLSKKELIDKIQQYAVGTNASLSRRVVYGWSTRFRTTLPLLHDCEHTGIIYQASIGRLCLLITTSAETSLVLSPYLSVIHSFSDSVAILILLPWFERVISILSHPHGLLHCTLFLVAYTIPSVSHGPLMLPLMKMNNMCFRSVTLRSIDFTPVLITLPSWNTTTWAGGPLVNKCSGKYFDCMKETNVTAQSFSDKVLSLMYWPPCLKSRMVWLLWSEGVGEWYFFEKVKRFFRCSCVAVTFRSDHGRDFPRTCHESLRSFPTQRTKHELSLRTGEIVGIFIIV